MEVLALHWGQPGWWRRRVGFPQDREDSRGVRWRLDERCVGLHFELLQAGSSRAAGAAVQGVRFGAVGHLIFQLEIGGQGVNLVNHIRLQRR